MSSLSSPPPPNAGDDKNGDAHPTTKNANRPPTNLQVGGLVVGGAVTAAALALYFLPGPPRTTDKHDAATAASEHHAATAASELVRPTNKQGLQNMFLQLALEAAEVARRKKRSADAPPPASEEKPSCLGRLCRWLRRCCGSRPHID